MRKLPDEFGVDDIFIKVGSLDVLPAEKRFDPFQKGDEATAVWCKEWKRCECDMVD